MRVLNVIGKLDVGGAERYLSRVSPILRRQYGIEVEICVLWPGGALEQEVKAEGIPVHTTSPGADRPATILRAVRAIVGIARLIRERRYDVVHSYFVPAETFATAAGRSAGCRRTIISRRQLRRWRRPQGAIYALAEELTGALAHELVANASSVLRDAERTQMFLPRKRTVIYSGVDVTAYAPAHLSSEGPLRLVTVGSLVDRKGHHDLIRALRAVREAGIDASLTIVGAGPDEHLLRRSAADQHVGHHVLFAGLRPDPRPFLVGSDIFVLSSITEGFSNALLEAMASSLPVVATDVGGNAEAVLHGVGGLLVPPGDPAALARALIQLGEARDRLVSMGTANRERVEQLFSISRSADDLARWYLEANGGTREGSRRRTHSTS